jgi:hypothetical protein
LLTYIELFFNPIRKPIMQVKFESNDPEGSQLRDVSVSRVNFVIRRMAWLVSHAKVNLADINGPHGGVDKRCRVEFKTAAGTVVVTSMATDWRGALEQALAGASRTLLRAWRRKSGISRASVRQTSRHAQLASPA